MSEETKKSFKENWNEFVAQGKECIEEAKHKETRKKQIPNMFTASRLLAPFFIIPTALSGKILLTAIFTAGFALTDAADGYFARKFNATSEFGRKLDPITDKLFAASLLIPLIVANPIMIINFIGEAIISLINTRAQLNGNKPRTLFVGKVKTGALYGTIGLNYLLLALGINTSVITALSIGTALLQTVTAIQYYKVEEEKNAKNIEENKETEIQVETQEETEKTNNKDLELISNMTIEEQVEQLRKWRSEVATMNKELEEIANDIHNKTYTIEKK